LEQYNTTVLHCSILKTINLLHQAGLQTLLHQEARQTKDLKYKKGRYKNGEQYRPLIGLLHTQFDVLVEGFDFHINALGDIELLNR